MSETKLFIETRYDGVTVWLEVIRQTQKAYWTEAYPKLGLRGKLTKTNPEGDMRFASNIAHIKHLTKEQWESDNTVQLAKGK
jgi:hypothetical protein